MLNEDQRIFSRYLNQVDIALILEYLEDRGNSRRRETNQSVDFATGIPCAWQTPGSSHEGGSEGDIRQPFKKSVIKERFQDQRER